MVASAASPLPAALRLAVLATLLLACSAFSGLGPAAAGLAARRTASPAFASASPVARSRATTRSLTLAAGKEANGEGRTRAQQVLAAVPWKPLVGSASVVATASLLAILVDPPLALVPFAVAGLLYPFGKRGRLSSVPDIFRRKRARKPLIVGNWKLNPTSISECQSLASLVAVEVASLAVDKPERDVEVAIIPPAPFLTVAGRAVDGSGIRLGAQNVYEASSGAFTGEWSGEMLHSLGCSYVLVGHSERRSIFGETDNVVAKKIRAALKAGLTPILCIGETQQEYEEGLTQSVTAVQAQKVLFGLSEEEILRCVIAYEPVWAIGTGLSASPAVIESVHHQIRSELRSRHGKRVAEGVRILYGGSVTPNNVNEIMACPNVDGCLVGGASLAADQFCRILNYSEDEGAEKKLWATEVVPCRNVLGESPVYNAKDRTLTWLDIPGKMLWQMATDTAEMDEEAGAAGELGSFVRSWPLPDVAGCLAIRAGGGLIVGFQSGLARYDPQSGMLDRLCDFEPGLLATRPNDGRVDRYGNLVLGSYNAAHRLDARPIGGLYRLGSRDLTLHEILEERHRVSNCICFSPQGDTMYFCDSPTRRIWAYEYSPNRKLRHDRRRLIYEVPVDVPGFPDGATVDASGGVWVTISGGGRVLRLTPEGALDRVVYLPVMSPTSCAIGGHDLNTLFITTRGPDGGGLWACALPAGLKGISEPHFDEGGPISGTGDVVALARAPPTLYGTPIVTSHDAVGALLAADEVDEALKDALRLAVSAGDPMIDRLTPSVLKFVVNALERDSAVDTAQFLQRTTGLGDSFTAALLLAAIHNGLKMDEVGGGAGSAKKKKSSLFGR